MTENGRKWWFPTIIWKNTHTIQFKVSVYTYCVSVQYWFAQWPRWPNFAPLVATKWLKMMVSDHYVEKSFHVIQFKLSMYTHWESVQNWFAFWSRWPNFGPLVATELLKIVVSDQYLKRYSRNPIQAKHVHSLGECSELICFLVTLAKFWPSSGHRIIENCGFRPISEKVFM